MRAIFETLFDIVYLVTVITIGIRMIRGSKGNRQFQLFGWMAVVLGVGDSFHLVPRALALCTTGFDTYAVQLGLGKWITSITMTVFYVLLYYVWRERYQVKNHVVTTAAIFALAAMRVALCMLPQNQWLTNQTPLEWGILRNIPFAIMGLMVIVPFYRSAKEDGDEAFRWAGAPLLMEGLISGYSMSGCIQSGTGFPDGRGFGKCVPEFAFGMGCSFRLRALVENATRNMRSESDAVSQRGRKRKLHPTPDVNSGTQFPRFA